MGSYWFRNLLLYTLTLFKVHTHTSHIVHTYPSTHLCTRIHKKCDVGAWRWECEPVVNQGKNRNNIPMPGLLAAYAHIHSPLCEIPRESNELGKMSIFILPLLFLHHPYRDFMLFFPIHPSALSSWADVTAVITTPLYTHFKTPFPASAISLFFSLSLSTTALNLPLCIVLLSLFSEGNKNWLRKTGGSLTTQILVTITMCRFQHFRCFYFLIGFITARIKPYKQG